MSNAPKNNQLTFGTFLIDRLGTKNCQLLLERCLLRFVCCGGLDLQVSICKRPRKVLPYKKGCSSKFFQNAKISLLISVNLISLKQYIIPSLIFNSVKKFR